MCWKKKEKTDSKARKILLPTLSVVAILLGGAGAGLGTYALTSRVNSKPAPAPEPTKKDHTFGSGQILINNNTSSMPLNLDYSYRTTLYTITNNVSALPNDTAISYTLEPNHDSKIEILEETANQWKLRINTGLMVNTYDFAITCSLHHSDYTDENFTNNFHLIINENDGLPTDGTLLFNNSADSPTFNYSPTQTQSRTYNLSISSSSSLPDGTVITYTKNGNLAAQTWWEITGTNGDVLKITNSNNGAPLACGSYALGVSINLKCSGYTEKTYTRNFTLTVSNNAASNNLTLNDTLITSHPEYIINVGTTLYYNAGTSAGSYANKFLDLYAYARDYASDLASQITFTIGSNINCGLLIDPRFADIAINGNTNYTISITPENGNQTLALGGILMASRNASGNPAAFSGKLLIDQNTKLTVDNTVTNGTTGIAYGFSAGIFTNAKVNLRANITVRNILNEARGIHINGTTTGSDMTFSSTIVSQAIGLKTSGAPNNAYGVYYNGSIIGGSIDFKKDYLTTNIPISATGTGATFAVYFAQDVTANLTIASEINLSATSGYRGAAYSLVFNSTVGNNLAVLGSSITLSISGKFNATNITGDKYSANTMGIVFTSTISSFSSSIKTTININELQILSKSNNLAYGIQFNNTIGKNTIIKEFALIDCYSSNNGSQSCVLFASLVNGQIEVGGVMNSYLTNAHTANGILLGLNISILGNDCNFIYSGVMSILYNPVASDNTNNCYARGINISGAIETNAVFQDSGIINIRASTEVRGINIDAQHMAGTIIIGAKTGETSTAVFNLIAFNGLIKAIYVYGGETSADIQMNNTNWCLNTTSSGQTIFFTAYSGNKPYKGQFHASRANIVTSSNSPGNYNTNYCTNTFTVEWNNGSNARIDVQIGNDSVPTNNIPAGLPSISSTTINYIGTQTSRASGVPVCVCDNINFHFWLGTISSLSTPIPRLFNASLRSAFNNYYNNYAPSNAKVDIWLTYAYSTSNDSTGWYTI